MSASPSVPLLVSTREHRRSRAGARNGQPQQIDLFGDARQSALMAVPAWRELPVETQATLTNLMTRLILEHVQGSRAGSAMEASYDL
ncbi:hypothetical protein [Methylovirgula sp. HY1]|uniref:hypothetical protein n=1 Tax=Methylovirgula sp. HY1 TaxID=2822761 RepID=UPI001C5A98C5|nr:hypothetical protein [Methylovirgula sp. HY1]